MNVTHTNKFHTLKMEIMTESVLDQQSYVKEERIDDQSPCEMKHPLMITTQHSNVEEIGTRLTTDHDRMESSDANIDQHNQSLAENSQAEREEEPLESSKLIAVEALT